MMETGQNFGNTVDKEMAGTPARIVYLGDLDKVVDTLRALPGVELAGWIYERGEPVPLPEWKNHPDIIPVLNAVQVQDALEELAPLDLGIVSNFGIILSKDNLSVPRLGFVNAHLGLLPENPGREPVAAVLKRGEKITGVTLHRMTEKVDAGQVIDRMTVSAGGSGPGELFGRLSSLAGEILAKNLPSILTE